jgi:predicted transcriptional regulator of viral defense system
MIIGEDIKKQISSTPDGVILTIGDFNVDMRYQGALVKALNRLVDQGTLQRLSKGKYYKPRKTIFGILEPTPEEITKDLLEKNGKLVGYITGNRAFALMGLTTQITSSLLIGTNRYRHPQTRGDYTISFLQQHNPITEENIPLLRILDALKFIKDIPASSPDIIVTQLGSTINALSNAEQKRLTELAENYTAYVRAILGAIMEQNNLNAELLKKGLNGTTNYKLPISEQALPNKKKWNII